jgi:hypothetical protein
MDLIGYLINIVFAASTYWGVAAVSYVVYLLLKSKVAKLDAEKDKEQYETWSGFAPKAKVVAIVLVVLGIFMGVTSPSNTYKHSTDYNKQQDLRQIQRIDQFNAERPVVIQDISRQPQSAEERAANSVDMRARTSTGQ